MDQGAEQYRRYLSGEDSGLVEIIRLYQNGLILFLNRYVRNFHAAEEIAEDTFFRLAVKKPRYEPRSSFKTWLYTIGRNQALNYLKRHSRTVSLEKAQELAELESVENAFLREERQQQIHRALDSLNDSYAQALYLKYFEEMSNEEIASVMRKNRRQIENLLYQARRALRASLEQEGFTYEEL